jgi:hypothetical protein
MRDGALPELSVQEIALTDVQDKHWEDREVRVANPQCQRSPGPCVRIGQARRLTWRAAGRCPREPSG